MRWLGAHSRWEKDGWSKFQVCFASARTLAAQMAMISGYLDIKSNLGCKNVSGNSNAGVRRKKRRAKEETNRKGCEMPVGGGRSDKPCKSHHQQRTKFHTYEQWKDVDESMEQKRVAFTGGNRRSEK